MRNIFLIAILIFSCSQIAYANSSYFPAYPVPIPCAQGGTGLTSGTTNQVLAFTGSCTIAGTATPTLTGTNFTGVPFSGVTGTVPCNQGGTNLTGGFTLGDIFVASGSCSWTRATAVAAGSVLASNGVGAYPIYTAAPSISGANFAAATIPNSALATVPITITCTTYTPTDQSGASLTFSTAIGHWCKTGQTGGPFQIMVTVDVMYPVTANGSAALISLPDTSSAWKQGIMEVTSAAALSLSGYIPGSSAAFYPVTLSSSVTVTNAQLSNAEFIFSGTYLAPS